MPQQEQGHCPKCGAMELDYGTLTVQDNLVYYPCTCEKCGHTDKEWYSLNFVGFNTK